MSETTHERPGLGKLALDQQEVVTDLRAGFGSRRALLEWMVRAAVRTAGKLDPERPAQYLLEPPTLAALLEPAARERLDLDDVLPAGDAAQVAATVRRYVAVTDVLPACKQATRAVRWNTVERTENDDETAFTDPAGQAHVGMRPALTLLEQRQVDVLGRFLDGLAGGGDPLEAWYADLNLATYGEHADQLEDMLNDTGDVQAVLAGDLSRVDADGALETAARRAGLVPDAAPENDLFATLLDAGREHGLAAFARFLRELVAVTFLVPAFVDAAALVTARAQEAVETTDTVDTEAVQL